MRPYLGLQILGANSVTNLTPRSELSDRHGHTNPLGAALSATSGAVERVLHIPASPEILCWVRIPYIIVQALPCVGITTIGEREEEW